MSTKRVENTTFQLKARGTFKFIVEKDEIAKDVDIDTVESRPRLRQDLGYNGSKKIRQEADLDVSNVVGLIRSPGNYIRM